MGDVFKDDLDVTWLEFGTSFFSPKANRVRVLISKDVNISLQPRAKLAFSGILLMELPLEVLQVISDTVFKEWVKATYMMRVSKQMRKIAFTTRGDLQNMGYAWWTGSASPMAMSHYGDGSVNGLGALNNQVVRYLGVQGADEADVHALMREGTWLTNFAICLALVAADCGDRILGVSAAARGYTYPAYDSQVTQAARGATLFLAPDLMHVLVGGFHSPNVWHSPGLLGVLVLANVLLFAMNVDNSHWIPVRVSRHTGVVEAFMLM